MSTRSECDASGKRRSRERRGRILVRVEAILAEFWFDDKTSDAVRAVQLEGWLDVLDQFSDDEIRGAWAEYQRKGPRSKAGKLLRPDAGALHQIIVDARAKTHQQAKRVALPPPPEPEPKRISADRAYEILRAAGFEPKLTHDAQRARGGREDG